MSNLKLNTKKQWNEAVSYLNESKYYILFIIAIFLVSVFAGFFYPEKFTMINELIRDLISKTQDLKGPSLILYILQNNVTSAFLGLILGIGLGIFSLANAVVNGVVIGYVMNKVYVIAGAGEFWRLLPHGIFELPAIFISLGLGLKLGMFVFAKNKKKELKTRFYKSMNAFLLIVLPLLIIAAIIEGTLITLI
ncbi:stage II sporulation protein M [Candidatus Pacearchaeota archaeon]|nr:stage II sporulation protein M [Candidatus Pacearchaeota archaeon]